MNIENMCALTYMYVYESMLFWTVIFIHSGTLYLYSVKAFMMIIPVTWIVYDCMQ